LNITYRDFLFYFNDWSDIPAIGRASFFVFF
jgi:hypothetical protein